MPAKTLIPEDKLARDARLKAERQARYREKNPDRPTARDVDRAVAAAFVLFLRDLAAKKTTYSQQAHDNLNRKVRAMAATQLGGGEVAAHAVDVRLAGVAGFDLD